MKEWLAKLCLQHPPAKIGRICSEHFEDHFIERDVRHLIAPELYSKPICKLTKDAVQIDFGHNLAPIPRTTSKECEPNVNIVR